MLFSRSPKSLGYRNIWKNYFVSSAFMSITFICRRIKLYRRKFSGLSQADEHIFEIVYLDEYYFILKLFEWLVSFSLQTLFLYKLVKFIHIFYTYYWTKYEYGFTEIYALSEIQTVSV